MEVGLFEVLSS